MDRFFWRGCFERAVKTFVQTFIATLGVGVGVVYTADSFRGLPWLSALITAGVAAVLSVATSLGSPSFVAGNHPRFQNFEDDPAALSNVATSKVTVPDDITGLVEPDDDNGDAVYEPRRGE